MSPSVSFLPDSLLAQAAEQDVPLHTLLVTDMQARWNAGQQRPVEEYVRLLPGLNQRPEVLLDLVCLEWQLRAQFGPPPTREEYRGRFPELAPRLGQLLELHKALRDQDLATRSWAPSGGGDHDSPPCKGSAPWLAVPGYEMLGKLGQGGMGVVYQARQLKLNRVVALKMILAGGHAQEGELARFRTEAEAIARLQHPNIVQVHEVGEHEGKPFFSLEFCAGGSLDRKLDGTPWQPMEAAPLVETLARAMQAAHEKKVIHRDLKPANVLLSAEGTPKITDFGLAKKIDEAGQTASGAIMGTPSYMAPEQAAGKVNELGPACDVYALGAILYRLLTGRPPFKAATAMDTVLQVINDEPVPPRQLQSKTPRDLETICLKCLAKEPARRYATALALAEDLERFQRGEPVQARPVGRVERGWRWCRRNPVVAGLTTAVVLTLVLGAAVATLFGLEARRAAGQAKRDASAASQAEQAAERAADQAREDRARAQEEERKKDVQLKRAEWEVYRNHIGSAHLEWQYGSVVGMRAHLDQCQEKLRGWEYDYLATRLNRVPAFKGHTDKVTSVAYSPDGKRIASGSFDATVRVWDAEKRSLAFSLRGHTDVVNSVSFSPDGKRIASGSRDMTVRVWDAEKGTPALSLQGHTHHVYSVCFSPDGKRIASGSQDGTVKVWDAEKGALSLSFKCDATRVCSVTFSPDGQRVVSGGLEGPVKVWDANKGTLILSLQGHPSVTSVSYSLDGKRIASGSQDKTVKVWDAEKGTLTHSFEGHTNDGVTSVAFSPDGKRIASGGHDNTVKVWDVDRKAETLNLKGHSGSVESVAFSPDGKRISSGSFDHTVKVWDAEKGTLPLSFQGYTCEVRGLAFSPDGKRIVSGASNEILVKVWDAENGTLTHSLLGQGPATSVAFSPDSKRIASNGGTTVKVWNAEKGTETLSLKGHTSGIGSVAFSPDGKRIVGGSGAINEGLVKVWDAEKGILTLSLPGHTGMVLGVAFSPDGKRIASGSWDKTVKVWDAEKGTLTLSLEGHAGPVTSVAFSPDGKRIASGSWDNTVKVWDAEKGALALSLEGHAGPVTSVAFSPNDKRIASGSWDATVKVWDAEKGAETLSLQGHTHMVTSVAFSPDGKRLASGGIGSLVNTIKVWDAEK